jgi:hypothetical protein
MKTTQPLRGKSKNFSACIFLFYEFRKVNQHDTLFLPQADWFLICRPLNGKSKEIPNLCDLCVSAVNNSYP